MKRQSLKNYRERVTNEAVKNSMPRLSIIQITPEKRLAPNDKDESPDTFFKSQMDPLQYAQMVQINRDYESRQIEKSGNSEEKQMREVMKQIKENRKKKSPLSANKNFPLMQRFQANVSNFSSKTGSPASEKSLITGNPKRNLLSN